MVNHLKYIANVYYNENIEGFGSVVTQVQNFSPKTPFGEFLLLYIKTIIERKRHIYRWLRLITPALLCAIVFYRASLYLFKSAEHPLVNAERAWITGVCVLFAKSFANLYNCIILWDKPFAYYLIIEPLCNSCRCTIHFIFSYLRATRRLSPACLRKCNDYSIAIWTVMLSVNYTKTSVQKYLTKRSCLKSKSSKLRLAFQLGLSRWNRG